MAYLDHQTGDVACRGAHVYCDASRRFPAGIPGKAKEVLVFLEPIVHGLPTMLYVKPRSFHRGCHHNLRGCPSPSAFIDPLRSKK
jgi:hypothetical protein